MIGNQQKKSKWVWSWGKICSKFVQCCEKSKEPGIINSFFFEWKFKANIARNATFEGCLGPNFPDLGQKWQKTDYFQQFHFS